MNEDVIIQSKILANKIKAYTKILSEIWKVDIWM